MINKKILYVGGMDSGQRGAVGTHTSGVIQGFEENGANVHAVFLADQLPYYLPKTFTSLKAFKGGGVAKKVIDRLRISFWVNRHAQDYDFIYCRFDPFLSPLVVRKSAVLEYNDDFLAQIDYVADKGGFGRFGRRVRTSFVYRWLISSLERRCFLTAECVVCVTQKLSDFVKAKAPRSNTFFMANASSAKLDNDFVSVVNDESLRLGHVGTLTLWDGLFELVEAMHLFKRKYPEKKINFIVVGDGAIKEELSDRVSELGLRGEVKMIPSLAHDDAQRMLYMVDVVPLLKTIEGYGLSPIKFYEALCLGRFLLCSNIEHINEIHPDFGLVVSYPLDKHEICEALSKLYDNLKGIRENAAFRASVALEQHSWTARVQSLLSNLEARNGMG